MLRSSGVLASLAVLLATPAAAAVTFYTDEASFASAVGSVQQSSPEIICTGAGPCPSAVAVSMVVSSPFPGLVLTTEMGDSINYTDYDYYSQTFAHDFFTQGYDPSNVNYVNIDFPFPGTITAFGFDYSTYEGTEVTITGTDNDGSQSQDDLSPPALFSEPAGAAQTHFVGFVSDNYLDSVDLTLAATGDDWILARFYIGSTDSVGIPATDVATAPEPGSWALMLVASGLVGGSLRERRRIA